MVVVKHETVESIPLLHVVKQSLFSESLPIVFFIHGFTSAKEQNLNYAYLLAEKGFRVILPDTLHHGERNKGLREAELSFYFWDIVLNTIHDLKLIKDHFTHEGIVDSDHIGVAGTSMGGIVTLGAMTQYEWISAAVSLMGNPSYENFARMQIESIKNLGMKLPISEMELQQFLEGLRNYDLSLQPEKLKGRPLLFWHGKKDSVVPISYAYQFFESHKKEYDEEKWSFIIDEKAGHKVTKEGVSAAVSWFEKHLRTKIS